jgi:uncharacterized SAM-binding protein YcdF (DUF218 family)
MKRKVFKYLLGFVLVLLLCLVGTAISIRNYSKKFFDEKSDVAIVLGAGTSNGALSKVYEERVLHAINLLYDSKVDKIIFTGGYGENESISDATAAMDYALKKGISKNKLLIEEKSTITFFNIKNSKDIMVKENLSSALVVSDPYHIKRSMHMCDLIGIKALPSPTPTTMYRSRKTKFGFFNEREF